MSTERDSSRLSARGGEAEPPSVRVGDVLVGKFRVERLIGEGGMGFVLQAHHLQLEEKVAIKLLKRSALENPDTVERFSREARAAAKLKSEHVARVLDVGQLEDGTPFMVLEHLDGSDLSRVLAARGPLPISEAIDCIVEACEALAEAHARGIVHRDIKPENLFLVRRDTGLSSVKVLDFGISKVALSGTVNDVNVGSKQTTSILGTPYYMSPEQLRSTRTVDLRADIWSLGAVLFELLTGLTAWESQEFTPLVAEILESPHRSLRDVRPDAPEGLERVIGRCLEKNPQKRFANMAEVAVALVPYGSKRARVAAEKAVTIVRAAGMLTDPSLQVPGSSLPPSWEGPRASLGSIAHGTEDGVSSFRDPSSAHAFQPTLARIAVERGTGGRSDLPSRRRTAVVWGAIALAGLMVSVIAFVGYRTGAADGRPAAASPPSIAASPPAEPMNAGVNARGESPSAVPAVIAGAAPSAAQSESGSGNPTAVASAVPLASSAQEAAGRDSVKHARKRSQGAMPVPGRAAPARPVGEPGDLEIRHER
jgi:serine/threonine-protein kinase